MLLRCLRWDILSWARQSYKLTRIPKDRRQMYCGLNRLVNKNTNWPSYTRMESSNWSPYHRVFMNFRDNVEFCWINPMIETTQIESKIRGDKSTVNRHEPFARINYTKAINIPVLLLDFTI